MLRVSRDARIAVVGPNGAGKTTLVRTLVGDLAALEGYVQSAPTARVGFLAQAQLELGGEESVLDAMKVASGMNDAEARGHLARFLFRGEDAFKSVGVLSGGERSRLALARLAARHANLLVLDEPTNHLDLLAREQLEAVLQGFEGALLFVSHDRYFIDKLATEIWPIEQGVLKRFEGNWSGLQRLRASNTELPMPELTAPGAAGGTAQGISRESRVPQGPRATAQARSQTGKGAASERSPKPGQDPRRQSASKRKASPVRRVDGMRALEARISAMELQLRQLSEKVSQIAQSGNYMETRRAGEEYASLERSLRELYDEWAKESEKSE
jgi:ATP-binding cassette subfamily F protein 3